MARPPVRRPRRSRGVSLVELMIGLALGLFVVAVATTLLASQLRDARALTQELRLVQDLRATADLIARDLRRAGFWGRADTGVWQPGAALAPASNPYAASTPVVARTLALRYSRDAVENDIVDSTEQFGYRLRTGAIELQLGNGNWQALTDPTSMTVTGFDVAATAEDVPLGGSCVAPCPAVPDAACPPRQRVQRVSFELTARSTTDPRVVRSLRSSVRLRNDSVIGACPAA